MANAFKQQQDHARHEKLLAECKESYKRGNAIDRHRAVDTYARQADVSKEQAKRVLGLD